MNSSYHAILIGLNNYLNLSDLRYAEKDATDLFKVLTDEEIGLFPKENVSLLIGKIASWQEITQQLQKKVLEGTAEDTVLIYYAGHTAFIDEKVYILSSDLSKEDIKQNKLKYLSMSLTNIRDHVLGESKSKNIIVILDTCQSGAIISNERGEPTELKNPQKRIINLFERGQILVKPNQTRVILVSSPPMEASLEDVNLENGLFTYCILEGLKGGIASAEVTIELLINYLNNHELLKKHSQRPGSYLSTYGPVILTKPKKISSTEISNLSSLSTEIKKISNYPTLEFLSAPLDNYISIIKQVFNQFEGVSLVNTNQIVKSIRNVTKANNAVLLVKENGNWDVLRQDNDGGNDTGQILEVLAAVNTEEAKRDAFTEKRNGFWATTSLGTYKTALIFFINATPKKHLLFLFGNELNLDIFASDIFGHIVQGMFYGLEKTPANKPQLLQAYLLDYLKINYRYLPKKLYDIRHSLFIERLNKMSIKFQPIICFNMLEPYVSGYEALASDHEDNFETPLDLMTAAELWGDHFKIHLDQHFFEEAVSLYAEQSKATPGKRRPEDFLDISINVYPETLIRTRYFEKVKEVVRNKLVPKNLLHLEISEKSALPQKFIPGDGIIKKEITSFRDVLSKYVVEFGVSFAIDDFGVGASSVSRLAMLTPKNIKIDREILKADTVSPTIQFISNYAHTIVSKIILDPVKIVVEGFDEEIHYKHIKLNKLLSLGVEYVQGYLIGQPTDKLVRLDREKKERLEFFLNDK